jgi:DNA uptake protein ComE-like DNA-binding protein
VGLGAGLVDRLPVPIEARDVVAARDKLGRFVSPEELCEYTRLSPDRVDELRDLMIFT